MKKILAVAACLALILPQGAMCPPAKAQDATAASSRSSLQGIDVGSDQVTLHLDAPVKYNSFVTSNPARLVLELINTEVALTTKTFMAKGAVLKRVRAGQFSGDPNPIARVVMDLSQSSDYKISASGNDLIVYLGGAGAASAGASSGSLPSLPNTAAGDAAPMSTQNSADMAAIATQNSAVQSQIQEKAAVPPPAKVESAAATAPFRGVKRDIMASLPRDVISLDMDNMEITDVLKLMATKANLNIIPGPDVSGPLTLHLTNVPFNEAFGIILSMKGLVANQVGNNILKIETTAALTAERSNVIGLTRVYALNYKKASEVKIELDAVRTAEKRVGNSVADDANNQIIVTETPDGLAATERLLAQIDVRPQQVLIETKLVEIQLNSALDLGIQWDYFGVNPSNMFGQQGTNIVGANPAPGTTPFSQPFDQNIGFPGVTSTQIPGANGQGTGVSLPAQTIYGAFTYGRVTNNYFLGATLTAAASEGKAKILSDPKIATLNGKAATINITTQIPYVTSNVASTGVQTQTVAYTTTGIQLSVTPTITADGRINLSVNPNVSKPSAVAAAAGTTGAVSVDNRTATTTVLVKDGETIVIGGMITDSVSDVIAKVPLLGDIPLIGWLFKSKTDSRTRVELLIFVTTKIMPD